MKVKLGQLSLGILVMSLAAFGSLHSASAKAEAPAHSEQAKEILGKQYKKSAARSAEQIQNLVPFVREIFEKRLPEKYRKHAPELTQQVIALSSEFEMDPLFVLAVIAQESSFNPRTVGPVGEIGLMQLRPKTAQWIARKFKLKYRGAKTLVDPVTNVTLGIHFLSLLREQFESDGRLYISAYNMGAKNVRKAVKKKIRPKDYATRVIKRYLAFHQGLSFHFSLRSQTATKLASADRDFPAGGLSAIADIQKVLERSPDLQSAR